MYASQWPRGTAVVTRRDHQEAHGVVVGPTPGRFGRPSKHWVNVRFPFGTLAVHPDDLVTDS